MCGVCGGRPGWTNLGDVIIASKTWRYDTAELVRSKPGAELEVNQTVATYQITAPWLPKAEAAADAWSNPGAGQWPSGADWLANRPLDYELQGLWLLRELAEGRDPLKAPDLEQRCPDWEAAVSQQEERGRLKGPDITDAGREHVRTTLFRNRGQIPKQAPWKVLVGPLATGNSLVRDVDIWASLTKTERLVRGLDMKASALSQTGWNYSVDHTIVAKGVMDFADPERNWGFRPFAARAAAEVLLRFLRETLTPRGGGLGDLLVEGTGGAPPQNNPGTLLNARYGIVPFLDAMRSRELASLASWCDDPLPAPSVRVFTGPGGAGKTRLFLEWCRRLRHRGWVANFLPHDADDYFAALDARSLPSLLVLDYAEARFDQLEALLRHLGSRRGSAANAPCRVALLARQGGEWLTSLQGQSDEAKELLGAAPPIALTPLPVATPLRETVFAKAAQAFADRLGKSAPGAAPDLSDPRFERPFYVHLAALAAVEGRSLEPDRLLNDAVDHEYHRFWKKAQGEVRSLAFERAAFRLVAALTLRGRTARHELATLDRQVKGPNTERETSRGSDPFHDLVAELYPAPLEIGVGQVGGLEPDLLGETLVRRVLSAPTTEPPYLEQVAQGAGEAEIATMMQVLGRIDLRAPEVTGRWLVAFLEKDCAQRALPAWHAALALTKDTAHARLAQLLAQQLEAGPPRLELAQTIERQLSGHTVSLLELSVWSMRTLLANMPDNEEFMARRGHLHHNLGIHLSELGCPEEALQVTVKAVELRRILTEKRPDDFRPALAMSLNSLGVHLHRVGRREPALQATLEAVQHYRSLVAKRPDAFRPHLASSLTNLGSWFRDLGRHEEGLQATLEAVELRRELAEKYPDIFLPDLAVNLTNLGLQLSTLRRYAEALPPTCEAVGLQRTLVTKHPDAFLPHLANSLTNLGARLGEVGRPEEALQATREAVDHYRILATNRPNAFLRGLADNLTNLGTRLGALGCSEEALQVALEAVELQRALASKHPDASLPHLTNSLNNLGVRLSEAGRLEEALQATREAVELRRTLVEKHPDAFLPSLASGLANLSNRLRALGRHEEALKARLEAIEHYRSLAKDRPGLFLPDLAMSLTLLGNQLNDLGGRGKAPQTSHKAIGRFRSLALKQTNDFPLNSAKKLIKLSSWLSKEAHSEEARQQAQATIEHFKSFATKYSTALPPILVEVLNHLNDRLSELGRQDEALRAALEAVEHYRNLAAERTDVFLPHLASGLTNLGIRLDTLGRHKEALQATREAVECYRNLAQKQPDRFLPNLAGILATLGTRLKAMERHDEALQVTHEAVDLRRGLAEKRPGDFLPVLAGSLTNLGLQLSELKRREEARSIGREALSLFVPLFRAQPNEFRGDLTFCLEAYTRQLTTCGLTPSADETHVMATAALASDDATRSSRPKGNLAFTDRSRVRGPSTSSSLSLVRRCTAPPVGAPRVKHTSAGRL
jgi:tetratricopeptide (TPR) repeat protein/nucleoside phosphorylase